MWTGRLGANLIERVLLHVRKLGECDGLRFGDREICEREWS